MVDEQQMQEWAAQLQAKLQERFATESMPAWAIPIITLQRGPKYTRIVRTTGPGSGSAYGFIENATGLIYKADGWKRPAKGARGNMLGENPFAGCRDYGMEYR